MYHVHCSFPFTVYLMLFAPSVLLLAAGVCVVTVDPTLHAGGAENVVTDLSERYLGHLGHSLGHA